MQIPIVDASGSVIAWTRQGPEFENARMRHREAEQILNGPILTTVITLSDSDSIARAGGPRGWGSFWRCVALCSERYTGAAVFRDVALGASPQPPPTKARARAAAG